MPNILRTPATVPWFRFDPAVQARGLRNRLTPEVSYFYGPLGFAAQYFRMDQEFTPFILSPSTVDVSMDGFYFLLTYLLTGEKRTTYSQAVVPLRPFDPRCPCSQPGAWEVVLRMSRLDVSDNVFTPGKTRLADPALVSGGATELTFGFNWYLNAWVRLQFNWEHAWFDDPVRLGPGPQGRLNGQDSLLTRFQVIF
jgi:phosphate-selective porin